MRQIAISVTALVAIVSAVRAEAPVAEELKKLEGEWRYVSMESQGNKLTKEDARFDPSWRVVISGKDLTWNGRKKTFTIDPAKTPKEMDMLSLDGAENGQTHAAIYKMENERLTICLPYFNFDPSARPTAFKATAEDGRMLVVLERAK